MPKRRLLRYWSGLYVSPDNYLIETKPPEMSLDCIPLCFKTVSVLVLVTGLCVTLPKGSCNLFISVLDLWDLHMPQRVGSHCSHSCREWRYHCPGHCREWTFCVSLGLHPIHFLSSAWLEYPKGSWLCQKHIAKDKNPCWKSVQLWAHNLIPTLGLQRKEDHQMLKVIRCDSKLFIPGWKRCVSVLEEFIFS